MSQFSIVLYRTTIPEDAIAYYFGANPEVKWNFTIVPAENSFNVKYLDSGKIVKLKLSTYFCFALLWRRMTLNHTSSRSLIFDKGHHGYKTAEITLLCHKVLCFLYTISITSVQKSHSTLWHSKVISAVLWPWWPLHCVINRVFYNAVL